MIDYKQYFVGKKITVLGLGLLGRGLYDAKFLAECGADLIVTDLKDEKALEVSLAELKEFKSIKYVLGEHRLEDFRNRDFILKGAGVLIDSLYIAEARRNNIPIKMSASWFAELAQIPLVGVTGTRGKSTVTHMLQEIMKAGGKEVLLGGNVRGVSTLALLPKVTDNSIGLLELDSWQLQGFGEAKLSPKVAVFTSFMQDHLNYYAVGIDSYLIDKAQIFLHQKPQDVLVIGKQAESEVVEKYGKQIISRVVVAEPKKFPKGWKLKILGEHNVANAVCAIEAGRTLGISDEIIKQAVESFQGLPGRLEFLVEVKGIKIYNDNNSTTPEATIAALCALNPKSEIRNPKKIIWIGGGADKGLDTSKLVEEIPKYCKAVILLPGTGSDKIKNQKSKIKITMQNVKSLEEAVGKSLEYSQKDDIVLFSPAFASFGIFQNEYDRNDQFVGLVEAIVDKKY